MLRFRIDKQDLSKEWRFDGGMAACGSSWIRSFDSPHLETLYASTSPVTVIAVRERCGLIEPSEHRPDALIALARAWPLEHAAVTIHRPAATFELVVGRWGTAPIYMGARDGVLRGSWDPTDLYGALRTDLHPAFVSRFLNEFAHPYSRRTIFKDLVRATERSVVRWDGERLEIEYPSAAPIPRPHTLRGGADPPEIAAEIGRVSVRRWLHGTHAPVGVELSGGLDSAWVASMVTATSAVPPRSYGLLQGGAEGALQRVRRDEIIAQFRLKDTAIQAHDYPPLAAVRRIVPWEEIYFEAANALLARASTDGVKILLNGIGGDELCYLHRSEDEANTPSGEGTLPEFLTPRTIDALQDVSIELAPQPTMSYSTIEGLAAAATLPLAHGIWPIAPLATAELFTFVRSLPATWRRNRRLSREVLSRCGLSRRVTHPESTETFIAVFEHGIARAASAHVRDLFSNSRLADAGWVDGDCLRSGYEAFCDGKRVGNATGLHFYAAAVLEAALRQVESARLQWSGLE